MYPKLILCTLAQLHRAINRKCNKIGMIRIHNAVSSQPSYFDQGHTSSKHKKTKHVTWTLLHPNSYEHHNLYVLNLYERENTLCLLNESSSTNAKVGCHTDSRTLTFCKMLDPGRISAQVVWWLCIMFPNQLRIFKKCPFHFDKSTVNLKFEAVNLDFFSTLLQTHFLTATCMWTSGNSHLGMHSRRCNETKSYFRLDSMTWFRAQITWTFSESFQDTKMVP